MSSSYSGKTSYRRWLLNECLATHSDVFQRSSIVLDVGGKREIGDKGFRYPVERVRTWINLNIDANTKPEVAADATRLPVLDASIDVVVCTEVLEHLYMPGQCVSEIWRVLKPGGIFIGSAPFVFPVHGDPDDYYRYTESGLRSLLHQFSVVKIEPMGGSLGAIALLLEQELTTIGRTRLTRVFIRRLAKAMYRKDQKSYFRGAGRLTTGWFWRCMK